MAKIPLYYTFGNHMHWVDMQWLWGYHVLPGSIRDMLHFCRETGAKGNVNFDGIGYEKLAAEDPEALAELREAVQAGIIEPVGCSYGQPYGLFHGGESNIRQRIYGARTVRRLLGVWPKTFWEEEFDFFPQLPQMLKGCGFDYASLFFQWTWHTPEIPKEEVPVIWWEGQDGSKLLCATRNKLNLHQWPEDMDATFADLATSPPTSDAQGPPPLILQWLELMPSPDWMCRSELLLPKMRELLSDERFEIRMGTLGSYLKQSTAHNPQTPIPTRNYKMDEVWHGMSLGKNGDYAPRQSHHGERQILTVESLQALLSLFGRPYDNWDVYPTWEMEEAWRNLLAAQHHDNHECEGLCGHVAIPQYQTVTLLADSGRRGMDHLARRISGAGIVAYNPFGWARRDAVKHGLRTAVVELPAFGYKLIPLDSFQEPSTKWVIGESEATFTRDQFEVRINLKTGRITSLKRGESLIANLDLPKVKWISDKQEIETLPKVQKTRNEEGIALFFAVEPLGEVAYWITVPENEDALDLMVSFEPIHLTPDPGLNASAQTIWPLPANAKIFADHPYAIAEVHAKGEWLRKYPEGDWMTSPQWFETVVDPFTAQSFVDIVSEDQSSLLILHNGSQQWFRRSDHITNVINMIDPWDEEKSEVNARVKYRLVPHNGISNGERWRMGQELFGLPQYSHSSTATAETDEPNESGIPQTFSALFCDAPNVIPTAFYRETEDFSGKHVENYAGKGMGYPFVVRLVEFDGLEIEATLKVAGTVAKAYKTNHLGQILEDITDSLKVKMRPYEIATIYLDIVEGRKQTRDLDAKREIWATVHRVE